MLRGAVRHAGAASRTGVRRETLHREAMARLISARVGLALGGPDEPGSQDPPQPNLDGCPPEIVDEFKARVGAASSLAGRTMGFDDIVSPLSTEEFFSRQFPHRRPTLFRGPPERFAPLVEWENLDELICTGRLNAGDLRLFVEGQQVASELYAMTPYGSGYRQQEGDAETVDDRKVMALLRQGATLVVNGVHERLRSVADLVHAFETALHSYSKVNLYASWRPTRGFGTHWDDHDVYVVQVHGEKLWHLYGPTRKFPIGADTVLNDLPPASPVWTGHLTAGDMFYIPRGWWHDARVPPSQRGAGSIHLTCQARTLTGRDVLLWLGDKLTDYEAFRKDVPLMAREGQLEQYLEELKTLIGEVLNDRTAGELKDDYRSRWTERPTAGFGQWMEPWKSPNWDRYRVVLRGVDHSHLRRDDEDASLLLTANGWTYTLDPKCLPLVTLLAGNDAVTVAALKAVDPRAFSAKFVDDFIKMLIRRAIVLAVPPRNGTRQLHGTIPT